MWRDLSPLFPSGAERSALPATSPPLGSVALGSGTPRPVRAPGPVAPLVAAAPLPADMAAVSPTAVVSAGAEAARERLLDLRLDQARGDLDCGWED